MGLLKFLKRKKENIVEKQIVNEPSVDLKKQNKKSVKAIKETTLTEYDKIISKVIAKEFHEEAKEIIKLTTAETREEFLKYFIEKESHWTFQFPDI